MIEQESPYRSREELQEELNEVYVQLQEATDTIEAIRTGQVDALVVQGDNGHQLFTLKTAETYRVFIEKMTEGAVTLGRDGTVLYCNSQFANLVRMPLSTVIGFSFDDFVVTDNSDYYRQLFRQCWNEDCKGEVLITAGNDVIPVQLSLTTLELEEGMAMRIIVSDLSRQKKAQQQLNDNNVQLELINKALEASNHDLQQFASVASHDLQEPLRKIKTFSNLMKERQAELSVESERYLDKIIDSSNRMRTLIVDILNYSRLSATDEQTECVDLNELVAELLEDFELIISEKGATVHVGALPCISINRGQIRLVFQNLISNALKFSKEDLAPVIQIVSRCLKEKSLDSPEDSDGPFCLISIIDNGIGFDEKYAANIFSLFERLNAKDQFEGTGIGLAIAKKVIDKHDGLISARSKEDSGAEFQIVLPLNLVPG